MIINLLGPIVISPYSEQDALVILTHNSRTPAGVAVYDGVVYEEVFDKDTQFKHKAANAFLLQEGILRTELPTKNAVFVVSHMHWPGGNASDPKETRTVRITSKDKLLLVRDTSDGRDIIVDLGLTLELKPEGLKNLWDHLTDDG